MLFGKQIYFLLTFYLSVSHGLRCHVNIGNEKYIPNKYDVEDCPQDTWLCYTQETNTTGYKGVWSTTRKFGCDSGIQGYCRFGSGCYRFALHQITCCCTTDACNDGLKEAGRTASIVPFAIVLLFFI